MPTDVYSLQVLLLTLSGFVNRHQADVIAYLVEENRILSVGRLARPGNATMMPCRAVEAPSASA